MRTGDPLPSVGDLLATLDTGRWHWDTATGTVTVDAVAARLLDLPAEQAHLTEARVRSRLHPVDWNEITGVVRLALAEGTLGEVRIRIMGDQRRLDGRAEVVRVVRSRFRPSFDTARKAYVLTGTLQEVTDPTPGTAAGRSAVTGDWRRSREAFLLDAGRALAEARSTQEVLRVAANLSMPGFSPDGLAVFGVEADRLTIIGHHGHEIGDDSPFTFMPLDTDYPATEVLRTGRAVYLSSPEQYMERYPLTWPLARRFGRQSWAFLPLTVAGRTMGTWMAAFTYPVAFTPDERSVLTTVARMLAQALSRAGTAESERALTDGLQQSMLPRLGPQRIPGMSVAGRYVPTGGGLQVGGDWYDLIPLPSGRFALVIGDVQGHDVQAAGLMGQLRIALRAYASEGHPPDAVLARASRFLHGIGDGDLDRLRFATCLYVEVDPSTGVLEFARAGHPDPVIRMADATVLSRPTAGGLPLGIDPDADYPITRLILEPGETLLICTDGLIETGGHDLDTGWQRLRGILEEHRGNLEELADAVVQAVHGPRSHHTTGPLIDRREDDIAVLLLCRAGEGCGCGADRDGVRPPVRRTMLTVAQTEPEQISVARHQLRELLHDWSSPDQVDSAVLLLSEVLTNVLVHTDADALMVAEVTDGGEGRRVRIEVTDTVDDLPHLRTPGELASSGRGLLLIEILADTWGVDPRGRGKSIWFELYETDEADDVDEADEADDVDDLDDVDDAEGATGATATADAEHTEDPEDPEHTDGTDEPRPSAAEPA
ncbi:ATP-binding SpoIIE family protein phosphatase [Streptomyces sp. enrichment culture]|uniref:ATP-binding SpoIIE family protein phosphatase n=1 Tax=Streptomyces sp. enrichment culture TaxID=1795815 RepID=UPI003F54E483